MEQQAALERDEPGVMPAVPEGLRGRDLVEWAHAAGEQCLRLLSNTNKKYLEIKTVKADRPWPEGFFEASIDELMEIH